MQARKAGQTPTKTPDEKKQDREARKTDDALLRRKATPRRPRTEKSKQEADDKPENLQTSESEAEATDEGEQEIEETTKTPANNTHSEVEDNTPASIKPHVSFKEDEQETPIQYDKRELKKQKEDSNVVEKESSHPPQPTVVDTPVESNRVKEEEEDERAKEMKRREQELLRSYNQLWEAENQLREVWIS